jgi:hypothetical protein
MPQPSFYIPYNYIFKLLRSVHSTTDCFLRVGSNSASARLHFQLVSGLNHVLFPQTRALSTSNLPRHQQTAPPFQTLANLQPRYQQELDEMKHRHQKVQEENHVLNLKNTELLTQYNQAIADRSCVNHELLPT